MVGASLSLLLASRGIRKILIIESQSMDLSQFSHSSYGSSFDARSTALSWTSRNIYQSLGIWEQLEENLSRIDQIHVSDRHHGGLTRMTARDEGIDALGYVVENAWLGSILIDKLVVFYFSGLFRFDCSIFYSYYRIIIRVYCYDMLLWYHSIVVLFYCATC